MNDKPASSPSAYCPFWGWPCSPARAAQNDAPAEPSHGAGEPAFRGVERPRAHMCRYVRAPRRYERRSGAMFCTGVMSADRQFCRWSAHPESSRLTHNVGEQQAYPRQRTLYRCRGLSGGMRLNQRRRHSDPPQRDVSRWLVHALTGECPSVLRVEQTSQRRLPLPRTRTAGPACTQFPSRRDSHRGRLPATCPATRSRRDWWR